MKRKRTKTKKIKMWEKKTEIKMAKIDVKDMWGKDAIVVELQEVYERVQNEREREKEKKE